MLGTSPRGDKMRSQSEVECMILGLKAEIQQGTEHYANGDISSQEMDSIMINQKNRIGMLEWVLGIRNNIILEEVPK